MGAVTTVGTLLTNLRTVLIARNGLSGVAVYTGPVDDLSAGQEAIIFTVVPMTAAYRYSTLPGREVFEDYPIEGRIWVCTAGSGETIIAAARDRALAILEQVHDELDSYVGTAACVAALGVDDARISGWSLEQLVGDGYRDCRLTFTVAVKARFTPA